MDKLSKDCTVCELVFVCRSGGNGNGLFAEPSYGGLADCGQELVGRYGVVGFEEREFEQPLPDVALSALVGQQGF